VNPVPFEAAASEVEGVRVIAVRGELDLSTTPTMEAVLEEALTASGPVIIDLTECEFIDSTGIALIVRAWQRTEGQDGGTSSKLVVCSGEDQVGRVLEISGLGQSIPIRASRDACLAALHDEASTPPA
jgi:anti-anti-sigma factor